MVAGCGDQTARLDAGVAAEPPQSELATSAGVMTTRYPVMVIDDGDTAGAYVAR